MFNCVSSFNGISGVLQKVLRSEPFLARPFEAWVATGAERSSGEPLQIAYAGIEKHKNYFFETALRSGYEEHSFGKTNPKTVTNEIKKSFSGCQAIFFEVDPNNKKLSSTVKNAAFKIPVCVQWELDIRGSMEELNRKPGIAHIQKQWKRNPVDYEITNDERRFTEFFHKIYEPFVNQNKEADASLCSYEEALEKFRLGELLLAKSKGDIVGGVVLEYSLTRCLPACIAVKAGRPDLLRKGLLSGLIYQVIFRARERSFDKVNLGYTRPYLKDDVARFKSRLGAHPVLGYEQDETYLIVNLMQWSTALKEFLRANPFITRDDEGTFRTVIFAENNSHEPLSELKAFCSGAYGAGADLLDLYFFGKPIPLEAMAGKPDFFKNIRVFSSAELAA